MVLGLHPLLLVPKLKTGLPQDVGGEQDGGEGGDVGLEAVAPQAAQVLLQVVPITPPSHCQDI